MSGTRHGGRIDWTPNPSHWGAVLKTLHWTIAILVLSQIALGLYMVDQPLRVRFDLTQIHKSIGFTILALVIVRLLWRGVTGPKPPLPSDIPRWQRTGAHASHLLLYVLLIAQPLTGWISASSSNTGIPTYYFYLFEVPHITGENEPLSEFMGEVHEVLAWIFLAVIAVHVLAALKHHIFDRDTVLVRMLPGRTPPQ